MVKSSLDAPASDLDASFDMRSVATVMPTAGAFSLLEPIVLDIRSKLAPLLCLSLTILICKPACTCGRCGSVDGRAAAADACSWCVRSRCTWIWQTAADPRPRSLMPSDGVLGTCDIQYVGQGLGRAYGSWYTNL